MIPRSGWIDRLLELLLPPDLAEEVIGDLHEEWQSAGRAPGPLIRLATALWIGLRISLRGTGPGGFGRRLRLAVRRMGREPVVTVVFVSVMALGLGVNAAILSVADAVLLAPLPYPESERLAVLTNDHRGSDAGGFGVAYASVRDIRESVPSIETLGVYLDWQDVTYDAVDTPRRMTAAFVSNEYLELLGLEAGLGRLFTRDENGENAPTMVAVLGQGIWTTEFGRDPEIVGRTVSLNGLPFEVLGVMSDDRGDLRYLWQQDPVQLYLPLFAAEALLGLDLEADRGTRYLSAIALLRQGAGLDPARSEFATLSQRLQGEFPATNDGWSYHLEDLHEVMFSELRSPVASILAISLLVLLLVAVNLTTLSLLRASGRAREAAVRRALGGRRGDMLVQSVVESSLSAALALTLGLVGARWVLHGFESSNAVRLPTFSSIELDSVVITAGVVATIGLAILLGLVPMVALIGEADAEVLRSSSRGGQGPAMSRAQRALVSLQVGLAVVLLTTGGLLFKSYTVLRDTGYGFETGRLLVAETDLRPMGLGPDGLEELAHGVVADVGALPGVEGVFTWGPNRLGHGNRVAIVAPEGRWETNPEQRLEASRHAVMPTTLSQLGIQLVRGRDFERGDRPEGPRVVIVSESLARSLWPEGGAVGRRVTLEEQGVRTVAGVIGVARDARHRTRLFDPFGAQRDIYYAFAQVPSGLLSIAVRHVPEADLESLTTAVRTIIGRRGSQAPVYNVRTMDQQLRDEEGPARVAAGIMLVYAGLVVTLAALGLFGVLAHSVRLRAREIGIRKALGAERGQVVWWVVRRGLVMAGIGIAFGAVAAIPAGRLVDAALYGISPNAPSVILSVWAGLLLVAIAASWLPARFAAAVPPAEVLRSE